MLRCNQITAINTSLQNDFDSGIHYHATGTGKSWIAMKIVHEFHKRYPKKNILWICERKDVLHQQFSDQNLQERDFKGIVQKFMFLNFVNYKPSNWVDSLNSALFWKKPYFCVINRSFLTSQTKYHDIKNPIHLVIHDECHSIENNTTQAFYKWLQEANRTKFDIQTRIIGFSATPEYIAPLENTLTTYSIYDGFKDNVILPPKIVWVKSKVQPTPTDIITIVKKKIQPLPYKKIVVWCGMIEECIEMANLWYEHFDKFDICLDFSSIDATSLGENFKSFDHFYQSKSNAILFCAVKHREGSDIPNIDACIFMDLVEKRSERVFIQCMGRVLRRDTDSLKTYGLVIDFRAKSTIDICNRVQRYLNLKDIFPWNYDVEPIEIDSKHFYINELNMIKNGVMDNGPIFERLDYKEKDIQEYFIRPIPPGTKYSDRLSKEMKLIVGKNLFGNILRAIHILKMTTSIPHVTRGSCGSSLLCYLLGISHMDPVAYNISFARFINQYRDTLPDIDFDFPHYMRDEVFLQLYQKWGNKVARISNHVYYHEKSALREAIRKNGIHKFISKYQLHDELNSMDAELRNKIEATSRHLEGQFKGYSLHCGGIVYYPDGIPEDLILSGQKNTLLKQVNINKIQVAENKNFKIDILSSRGLSQLHHCLRFKTVHFNSHIGDPKTIDLLCKGDNIGITLAETPLMRKALILVQPKTIEDVAICLSIIRPAAKDARKKFDNDRKEMLIYDDDIIYIISDLLNCDEEMGDKLRRGFVKNDQECLDILEKVLSKKTTSQQKKIRSVLSNIRKYGFCKAHALSYAQLVWQLAYQKANHPKKFWEATLKNVKSCYRNWVHIYEARCHGVSPSVRTQSIYADARTRKMHKLTKPFDQLKRFGFWYGMEFYPGCYHFSQDDMVHFKGVIASTRMLNYGKRKNLSLLIGVEKQHYVNILVSGKFNFDTRKSIIKGRGIMQNDTIECLANNVEFY